MSSYKSILLGGVTGSVIAFVVYLTIGAVHGRSEQKCVEFAGNGSIQCESGQRLEVVVDRGFVCRCPSRPLVDLAPVVSPSAPSNQVER